MNSLLGALRLSQHSTSKLKGKKKKKKKIVGGKTSHHMGRAVQVRNEK